MNTLFNLTNYIVSRVPETSEAFTGTFPLGVFGPFELFAAEAKQAGFRHHEFLLLAKQRFVLASACILGLSRGKDSENLYA